MPCGDLAVRSGGGLLLVAVLLCAGCFGGDREGARQAIADAARSEAYAKCVAHGALENYLKQCEAIGAHARVERRTYVCEDDAGIRNPQGLGAGPWCTCPEHGEDGSCAGEADCTTGVEAKCAPLLEAEVVNFTHGD